MPFASLHSVLVKPGRAGNLPETQDTESCDHGSASIRPLALQVHITQGGEDIVHVRASFAEFVQCMGEDVEPERVSYYLEMS
jgi:hypothetical protein